MRRPIPAESVHPASLAPRRQTRPAAPMGRSLVPTAAAGPDYAVKTTPILTLVRVGTAVQTPGEVRLRPRLRPVPAVLLREPVTKLRRTPTVTAVPADIRSPAVRPPRFRPKPHLKSALAALPQVPAISAVQKLALTAAMYRPAQAVKPEPPCLMPD